MSEPPKVGDPVPDTRCPRCGVAALVIVELGSEAHLVRCGKCGFQFGLELGEV